MVFVKRVVPLILVALLLIPAVCLFAPSVSADGSGTNAPRRSFIPFETIGFGLQYKTFAQFTGQVVSAGMTSYTTNHEVGVTQVVSGGLSLTANNEIRVQGLWNTIRLTARSFVLDSDLMNFLAVNFGEEDYAGNISWTITGKRYGLSTNNNYVLNNFTVTGGFYQEAGHGGENFWDRIAVQISAFAPQRYVWIDSFVITFSGDGNLPPDYFDLHYDTGATVPTLTDWYNQFNWKRIVNQTVVVDPARPDDVSFVDWLEVAVSGFLEFELWNGFTLNQLIEFVVVIGLVLWFITLMI